MLADNKFTDRSSWDDRVLALHLKELSELALDFEIEITGFEPPEIDLLIQSIEEPENAALDAVQPPTGPAISRAGDHWWLGDHRLLCGDALDPESYATLLNSDKAAAVFTDPPYNVPIDGSAAKEGSSVVVRSMVTPMPRRTVPN